MITWVYGDRGVDDLGKYTELIETTFLTALLSSDTAGAFSSGKNGSIIDDLNPTTFPSEDFISGVNGSALDASESTNFPSTVTSAAFAVLFFTVSSSGTTLSGTEF